MKTIDLALSMFIASITMWPIYLFLIGVLSVNKIALFYETSFLPAIYILYAILLIFLAHKFNVNVIDNNVKSKDIVFTTYLFYLNYRRKLCSFVGEKVDFLELLLQLAQKSEIILRRFMELKKSTFTIQIHSCKINQEKVLICRFG